MRLPFSRAQFFDVIAEYNLATWPMSLVLSAIALLTITAVFSPHVRPHAIGWVLASFWAWMGVLYQLVYFTRINPAAWLFGAAFLAEAGLVARAAWRGTLAFDRARPRRQLPGLALVAYALAGYPALAAFIGQAYPRVPTFGLPCPTTIFTLGVLLLARRPLPASLFVIPLAWSAIGTVAAVKLGVTEDYGLPIAALVALIALVAQRRGASPAPAVASH